MKGTLRAEPFGKERSRTKAIVLHPSKGKIQGLILGTWLTSLLCVLVPAFSVAAVFVLPLFLGPLAGSRKKMWAYPVGLAALLIGAWLWTRQVFFPAWLVLAAAPPLVLAYRFPFMKLDFRRFLFWFWGAYALSVMLVLAWPALRGYGPLADWLSRRLTEALRRSGGGNALLYRLTAAGYLSLPEEVGAPSPLRSLLEQRPAARQLYLALELHLRQRLTLLLPALCMQVILLGGLMTGLRVWKTRCTLLMVDEEKKTLPTVTVSPGFSGLSIGRGLWGLLMGAGVAGLLIASSTLNDMALQLARVLTGFCSAGFFLSGGSVLCGLLMRQDEDRRLWAGLLTGAVYVLLPALLFLLGFLDPLLHYRSRGSFQNQKEDE